MLMSASHPREAEWFRGRIAKGLDRVRQLSHLLDKFLDLSRVHEGRIDLVIEEMDLVAAVRDVMTAAADELRWAGCDTELVAPERISGAWDRMRIQAIVANLVGNARKYGAGQPIVVTLTADDQTARIVVRDHGPGIPLDQQERIFQPFERLVSTVASPRISGMGLGLWIVRQFVEALGGTISVANGSPSGAELTVTLPLRR
jgi:signal transduction histidine kinase